jgi:hypothetical protein
MINRMKDKEYVKNQSVKWNRFSLSYEINPVKNTGE